MKVAIFGLGFVGLTTAVGFANRGIKTIGFDIDKNKIDMLRGLKLPFFENGLQKALKNAMGKNLAITDDIKIALDSVDMVFYCIGTPMDKDGSANLTYILDALKDSAKFIKMCKEKPIFIIKSTIPPASLKEVFLPFLCDLGLRENIDFMLASNPEFLREGFAYDDFINPDRIIIGADFEIAKLREVYANFDAPIFFVSPNTAEFIKYLSNTMLSMMISYANDMSIIAKSIGDIDIKRAFEILHLDKRFFGNPANIVSYIYPGMGFGGYCLPKDTLALYQQSKTKGYESKLLNEVLDINDRIMDFHIDSIIEDFDVDIGILGLSFKPNSDDIRDSKSYILIKKLMDRGYRYIHAYDPIANDIFHNTYRLGIKYHSSLDSILQSCKCLIVATAWREFRDLESKCDKKIYNFRYI